MTAPRSAPAPAAAVAHAACLVLVALLLVAAGQPLVTDDLWWHLALGEAYARQGPWLAEDPLLYTAPGPPAPAAWLADVALFGVERLFGFAGLRIAHVLAMAAALGLAWWLLRRASGSALLASVGTSAFAALATYRLVQLRPHLATILAALVLYWLLLEGARPPSRRRVATGAALLALWANLHGGFLLGPVFLAAGLGGLALAAALGPRGARRRDAPRLRGLAAALVLGLLATLLNPEGVAQHRAWFAAGSETPELMRVADEWLAVNPLRLPVAGLPPSPLAWGVYWLLLLATPLAALRAFRAWRRAAPDGERPGADPALLALAGAGLVAPLVAVRFLWLGLFPLLLLARTARGWRGAGAVGRRTAWAAALLGALLAAGFVRYGDWPMVARGVSRSWEIYAQPYFPNKYYADVVWLLDDAGLEGNAFNEYYLGGFLGYWLAPRVRGFVNGSLNVTLDAMQSNLPIRERRGARPGESFLELLDRQRVDLFFGIRAPEVGPPNRPWFYTTAHLEGAAGWVLGFRNLRSALYVRDAPRNAQNLERLAAWYSKQGVPFDPERGFDTQRVIREAPAWAVRHGLVPVYFDQLVNMSSALDPLRRDSSLDRLGSVYAALGLYEQAVRGDRRLARENVAALGARRRLVWSLLRLGDFAAALEAAPELEAQPEADWLSHRLAEAARRLPDLPPEEAAALVARLPVFTRAEGALLFSGVLPPAARPARR